MGGGLTSASAPTVRLKRVSDSAYAYASSRGDAMVPVQDGYNTGDYYLGRDSGWS